MKDINTILTDYIRRHHYSRLQPVAALIDMDGTLYDSMGNHAEAWRRMCEEAGLEVTRDAALSRTSCYARRVRNSLSPQDRNIQESSTCPADARRPGAYRSYGDRRHEKSTCHRFGTKLAA